MQEVSVRELRNYGGQILNRWKNVPAIDGDQLREDLAEIMDLDL